MEKIKQKLTAHNFHSLGIIRITHLTTNAMNISTSWEINTAYGKINRWVDGESLLFALIFCVQVTSYESYTHTIKLPQQRFVSNSYWRHFDVNNVSNCIGHDELMMQTINSLVVCCREIFAWWTFRRSPVSNWPHLTLGSLQNCTHQMNFRLKYSSAH